MYQISDKRYLTMVEDMLEFVCLQDKDTNFLFANKAFLAFLDKSIPDIYLQNEISLNIIHRDDEQRVLKGVHSFSPQRPTITMFLRYLNKEGNYSWIEWITRALFDENNNLLEYQSVGRDITEYVMNKVMLQNTCETLQKSVEKYNDDLQYTILQLQASNKYLHGILDSISDGVMILNRDGDIIYLNNNLKLQWGPLKSTVQKELKENYIKESSGSKIYDMLFHKQSFADDEFIFKNGSQQYQYQISGFPVNSEIENQANDGVLIFKPMENVHRLVNRMSGSYAKYTFQHFITQDPHLIQIKEQAILAAKSDSNIVIEGESGTGKEILAQAIHSSSARKNGPFIAINCGALPRDLISSELFGYVEGAFTGAQKGGRPGKFELASGGTLFLDEIGDMPIEQQIILLRVLQEKVVTRIGSHKTIRVNVRIICATNKNLPEEIQAGDFRMDLYYRLNVINFHITPLRQRKEDIPLLFDYFLKRDNHMINQDELQISAAFYEGLKKHSWPGNVRELQNAVEKIVFTTPEAHFQEETLQKVFQDAVEKDKAEKMMTAPEQSGKKIPFDDMRKLKKTQAETQECKLISELLERYHGNVSAVATEMGISRSTLYRKMKKYLIALPDSK